MVYSESEKQQQTEVQRGSGAATVWVQRRLGTTVRWRRSGTAVEGSIREQKQQVRGGSRGSEAEMCSREKKSSSQRARRFGEELGGHTTAEVLEMSCGGLRKEPETSAPSSGGFGFSS